MKKWIEAIIYAILKILCAVGVVLVAVYPNHLITGNSGNWFGK